MNNLDAVHQKYKKYFDTRSFNLQIETNLVKEFYSRI